MEVADSATLAIAATAAVAGVGAWVAAFRSARSARQSSEAAETLTELEQLRWHRDLTPQFEFACTTRMQGQHGEVVVSLIGPAGLDQLDRITIAIRDDILNREQFTREDRDREETRNQVWGPLRFRPGVDGADQHGRELAPFALPMGEWKQIGLEQTTPPSWDTDPQAWRDRYFGTPLRLTLRCERDGHDPWVLPFEVLVTPASPPLMPSP